MAGRYTYRSSAWRVGATHQSLYNGRKATPRALCITEAFSSSPLSNPGASSSSPLSNPSPNRADPEDWTEGFVVNPSRKVFPPIPFILIHKIHQIFPYLFKLG